MLAKNGRTNHPLLSNIYLAQIINLQCGGAVIAPWQVDELDETTLDAFRGLVHELPTYKRAAADTENRFEKFRRQHNYRM